MRFTTIACAALALISTASAAKKNTMVQYNVSCQKTYVVKNGDTCSKIGKAFKVYTSSIKRWNPSINAGCTNLYIDQILCLSAPTTHTSVVTIGTTATPTKTTSSRKTKTTTVLTMTNAGPQCKTNDDCAGARCCNLFTNECVLDPNGTICDIIPPKTSSGSQPTTAPPPAATCTPGSKGLGNGDGYNGACCSTQADCLDDCIKGVCNGPVNTKTAKPIKTPTATTSVATPTALPTGLTVQISSSKDFCLFLPASPGNKAGNGGKIDIDAIADSEKNAVAFCLKPNVNAPNAGLLPSNFIKSARYQTNSAAGFVQVRGTLNIGAYSLSPKDEGGQYDNHGKGSPPHSTCAGYPYYVSLIEPNTATFCIRCCETYSDCNAGRSAYGCDRVVPAL